MLHQFNNIDILYSYKGVVLPCIIFKIFSKSKVIYDFRTPPVEQISDFKVFNKKLNVFLISILRFYYNIFLNFYDQIIVVSSGLKKYLIQYYGVSSSKLYVLPLGVDFSIFTSSNQKMESTDEYVIMYSGSITLLRCPYFLFLAIKEIALKIPNVRLILLGSGPKHDVDKIKNIIKKLELQNHVMLHGRVDHFQVPKLLERADVTLSLLPNMLSYRLSSPAKIVEYLAMGKVVIASKITAHEKIIYDGINGILISNDVRSLSNALLLIYNDQDFKKSIESRSRNSVLQYEWNILLTKLEQYIMSLIKYS